MGVQAKIRSVVSAALILAAGVASAQTPTSWTRGAATAGLWSNSGQWNLSAGPVPDATTPVLFGVNTFDVLAQLQTTGAVGVSASAAGITFSNTTAKVIRGQPNTNANANTHTLRLGNSGITVAEASLTTGTVVIYNAPTGNASSNVSTMVVEVNNAQTFTNDSASPLMFGRADGLAGTLIRPGADSSAGIHALTLAGTGAGPISFYAAIQDQPADATKIRSLVVNRTGVGTGAVQLFGANTYSGPTTITAGTLLINGTNSGGGATTVGSGGALGGIGSLAGAVTFDAGSKFLFNSAAALTIPGSVSFTDPSSFGIDDLVGLDSTVGLGTYRLLSGSVNTTGLANLGVENAASLGAGKWAYFQAGSLDVVVSAVPEPAALGLGGAGLLAAVTVSRRLRRCGRG
jgi:fibronectin-binding autotransporter adhesin